MLGMLRFKKYMCFIPVTITAITVPAMSVPNTKPYVYGQRTLCY